MRYSAEWLTDSVRFSVGGGVTSEQWRSLKSPWGSEVLSAADLVQVLRGNKFAELVTNPVMGQGLTLPPGTQLTVRVPEDGFGGEVRFKNKLVDILISTNSLMGMIGGGTYMAFVGDNRLQPDLWRDTFITKVTIAYSPYRVGDPMMADMKLWATQLVERLRLEFDEEVIWQRARDSFSLNAILPEVSRATRASLALGPIGMVNQPATSSDKK